MKETINAERPYLDKLIVDVIQGQTEFRPEGTDFDSVVVAIQSNRTDGEAPSREKIFGMTEILLGKMLIKRKPTGHFVATDLNEVAKDLGIAHWFTKKF